MLTLTTEEMEKTAKRKIKKKRRDKRMKKFTKTGRRRSIASGKEDSREENKK